MAEFQSFNPNPRAAKVGDCAVRAVAKALGIDWYQSYVELASEGLTQCDMPSANNETAIRSDGRTHGVHSADIPQRIRGDYAAAQRMSGKIPLPIRCQFAP